MDSSKEIQEAVKAILKKHGQTQSDYHAVLRLLPAIKRAAPQVFSMPQVLQALVTVSNPEAEDTAGRLEDALEGNQPFAALLQEYASRPEVPLADYIQTLKQAGFQAGVN
jgi:lysophospholipase L1-like esterase